MTYRQLIKKLFDLSPEQLDCDVTIYLHHRDEFFAVSEMKESGDECDVLDANHPYLEVNEVKE